MSDRTTHLLRHALALAVAYLLFTGPLARGQDAEKELKNLEGTWQVVSREVDGQKVSDDEVKKLTLNVGAGGKGALLREGTAISKADATVYPDKKPKQIDLVITEGENKGQTARGIYELQGDTLRICIAVPGKERPTEFSSKAGSGQSLTVYKR